MKKISAIEVFLGSGFKLSNEFGFVCWHFTCIKWVFVFTAVSLNFVFETISSINRTDVFSRWYILVYLPTYLPTTNSCTMWMCKRHHVFIPKKSKLSIWKNGVLTVETRLRIKLDFLGFLVLLIGQVLTWACFYRAATYFMYHFPVVLDFFV